MVPAAALVEPPEAGLDRGVCSFLQRQVQRCFNREALLVQLFRPVRALQILAYLLDEIRRRRLSRCRLSFDDDRLLPGGVRLGLRDIADVCHSLEDVIAPAGTAPQNGLRDLTVRRLYDSVAERC